MKIFVTGNKGQLGQAIHRRLSEHPLTGGDLPEWDMTDAEAVQQSIRTAAPDAVIHAAALTAVDYCAEHPREAVRINGGGTYNIALACRHLDIPLIAISTNEVFDGQIDRPYQEYDTRHPINPYGYSKFVAEQVVERYTPHYLIVRTAWLYAPGGTNFIHKIVARARSGQPLRVVTDEIGSPTYVDDLVDGIAQILNYMRPGIYHLTNAGSCSRYEFAEEILRLAGLSDITIEPITSDAFQRASTPPAYAPLDNTFAAMQGITLRSWQDALTDYIQKHGVE